MALSIDVSTFCRFSQTLQSRLSVSTYTLSIEIHNTKCSLWFQISIATCFWMPEKGLNNRHKVGVYIYFSCFSCILFPQKFLHQPPCKKCLYIKESRILVRLLNLLHLLSEMSISNICLISEGYQSWQNLNPFYPSRWYSH